MTEQRVREAFVQRYGQPPALVVRAPGRVNLIGEHTDYNDGFVLPMAIDRAVYIALRPRPDRQLLIHSLDFDNPAAIDLDNLQRGNEGWVEYVKGVAWVLAQAGYALTGWEGVVAGDVPIGAGLSSSAALEIALARAFAAVGGWAWEPAAMARLGQRVENEWVGVNSGIMDQMIVASGQAGHALLIDCRSLETEPVPLPAGTAVVVMDTNTRRGLVDSAYNERRQQCEAAARFFGVPALRDVNPAEFAAHAAELDPLLRRRAGHVVSENERVLQAVQAMREQDATMLGRLMNASHESLRDDFEVSSPALDALVNCARRHPACYGARMTGAGFGGCAVALVQETEVAAFVAATHDCYLAESGREPALYICTPSDGATLL